MLDVDRLRALHAVATHGSVSAAADALGVTTSAVSQKLAKLERDTKARLIERHGRGVRITDAALLLVQHAEEILARVEQAESDFEAHRGDVAGQLSISAFPTAARGLLPTAVTELTRTYPRLDVRLAETEPPEAVREVARGSVDLAVVQDWESLPLAVPEELARQPLIDDVADLALPTTHPLARHKTVDLSRVTGEPWVSSPIGAVCYDLLVYTIRSYDVEPCITHTAAEYETQLALVSAGFGLAILPRLGRGTIPPNVRVVPTRPVIARSVYAIWRRRAGRRPVIRAALATLREAAAQLPHSATDSENHE